MSVVATVAVAAAVFLFVTLAQPGSSTLASVLAGGLPAVAALTVALVWLAAGRRVAAGRAKQAFRLIGIAMIAWGAGETVWLVDYQILGGDGSAPPSADLIFAVTMLLAPLAVVLLFGTRRFATLRTLLDAMLIACAVLYIAWATVLGPLYHARGGGLHALGPLTYPLAEIVVISMIVILVRDTAPALRTSAALAAAGIILMCASDCAYAYLATKGTYQLGHVTDIGWFLGLIVIAVAAPRRHELAGRTDEPEYQSNHLYLPYVPFVLALGTAAVLFVTRHGQLEPALYVISAVLVVLMVIRQLVVLGDNQTLTRNLKRAIDDLRFRAYHDPLTGLANRDKFMQAVEGALAPATGPLVAVLYIDLDGFKPINDTYGHAAGDRVLAVVAERLKCAARTDDVVARLGGDEFAIVLADLLYAPDAHTVAQRIHTALEAGVDIDGDTVRVGASIGVAYGRAGRIRLGELLRNADVAMYTAKVRGHRRTVVFEPHLLAGRPLGRAS